MLNFNRVYEHCECCRKTDIRAKISRSSDVWYPFKSKSSYWFNIKPHWHRPKTKRNPFYYIRELINKFPLPIQNSGSLFEGASLSLWVGTVAGWAPRSCGGKWLKGTHLGIVTKRLTWSPKHWHGLVVKIHHGEDIVKSVSQTFPNQAQVLGISWAVAESQSSLRTDIVLDDDNDKGWGR